MDYDIPNRIEEFIENSSVRPNSLLLTKEQYDNIIKNIGIKDEGEFIFKTLYGLDLIFTTTPIPQPRILKITDNK